jgi:hypothetical protein
MDQKPADDGQGLPHGDYMAAVVGELTAVGIAPKTCWAESPDGQQLDGYFELDTDSGRPAENWPDGVGLGWDQYNGWLLISRNGARTVYPLSPDSGTYSQPRQIATNVWNRLVHGMDGWMPGPIAMTGEGRFDTESLIRAVKDWEAQQDDAPNADR